MSGKKDIKDVLEGEEEITRVRLPEGKEVIGVIESRLGYGRFNVICSDKKIRVCRVPGRLRNKLWLREGDYIIVLPWDIEGDKKGDIIYKYKKSEVNWLEKEGYLKDLTL